MKPPVRRGPRPPGETGTRDTILNASTQLLKREGVPAATTQRIAQEAGISASTLYNHFAHKRDIFSALHDRHVEEISRVVEHTLAEHAHDSLPEVMRALVEALIDIYAADPKLYQLLVTEVPSSGDAALFAERRLREVVQRAVKARAHEFAPKRSLPRVAFMLTHMLEALAHGVAFRRPRDMPLVAAKEEGIRAILAYLSA